MLAAYCSQPGSIDLREVARPEVGHRDVLIRVRHCGICGSDLHFYHGASAAPRACLGHEIAGEVVAVGSEVTRVRTGDAVAVEPLIVCGTCAACRRGDYQLCPRLRIAGFHRDGGFAQLLAMPDYAVYRLPSGVGFDLGALAEPLAVGVHAVRLAAVVPGERVLVLGAGTIGLLAIAAAAAAGATDMWVTARHAHQAAAARSLGATRVFTGNTIDAELQAVAKADPVDVVIETVGGTADTIHAAIRCVRPGGRVAVLGVFSNQPAIDAVAMMVKEVKLFGSMTYGRSGSRSDFDAAIELLAAHPDRFGGLITHRVSLQDISRGFEIAGDKACGSIKVLVAP